VHSGYAQFSNISVTFAQAVAIPNYECNLYTDVQTNLQCNPDPTLSILKIIISVPNLALLVRAGQILAFVDDFTYFVYHKKRHSPRFRYFCLFMWKLTNAKWVPEYITAHIQGYWTCSTAKLDSPSLRMP